MKTHSTSNTNTTKKNSDANKKERKKRPRTSTSPTATTLAKQDGRPVKKQAKTTATQHIVPKLQGKEYVGQHVHYKSQSGKVLRYFSGDDEDESVWKIVFDNDGGDVELEEEELRKTILTFQRMI